MIDYTVAVLNMLPSCRRQFLPSRASRDEGTGLHCRTAVVKRLSSLLFWAVSLSSSSCSVLVKSHTRVYIRFFYFFFFSFFAILSNLSWVPFSPHVGALYLGKVFVLPMTFLYSSSHCHDRVSIRGKWQTGTLLSKLLPKPWKSITGYDQELGSKYKLFLSTRKK